MGRPLRLALGTLLLGAVLLGFASPKLPQPLIADDIHFAADAELPVYRGYGGMYHAPLYPELMRWCHHALGWRGWQLRWLGVIAALCVLGVVVWCAERLQPGAGWISGTLWALHPLVVQGMTILDIDNTVLLAALVLALAVVMRWRFPLTGWRQLALTLGFAVLLWAKETTPWALLPTIVLVGAMQGRTKDALQSALIAGLGGAALFAGAWWWYTASVGLDWRVLFERTGGVFLKGLQGVSLPPASELFNRALRIGLWLEPAVLGLWGWALVVRWQQWRRARTAAPVDWWFVMGAIVLLGYLLIGGTIFGLAKYHIPVVACLAVSGGVVVAQHTAVMTPGRLLWLAVIVGVGMFLRAEWIGDLLYTVNQDLRHAYLFAPAQVSTVLIRLAARLILLGGLLIGLVVAGGWQVHRATTRGRLGWGLLVAALSAAAYVNVVHVRAPYMTAYCYGRSLPQFQEATRALREWADRHPGRILIAPEDVLYHAGIPQAKGFDYASLQWGDAFARAVSDPRVGAVIYEPSYNSSLLYHRLLADPTVQQVLHTRFQQQRLGAYTMWLEEFS